jgi:hypothetical protein
LIYREVLYFDGCWSHGVWVQDQVEGARREYHRWKLQPRSLGYLEFVKAKPIVEIVRTVQEKLFIHSQGDGLEEIVELQQIRGRQAE